MANRKDISGQWFGRLFALRPVGKRQNQGILWLCLCSCGSGKVTSAGSLGAGKVKSCGCLNLERCASMGRANAIKNNSSFFYAQGVSPYVYGIELDDDLPRDRTRAAQVEWSEHY